MVSYIYPKNCLGILLYPNTQLIRQRIRYTMYIRKRNKHAVRRLDVENERVAIENRVVDLLEGLVVGRDELHGIN